MSVTSKAEAPNPDREAVKAVATEYFQCWFAGDGERMRACLHPALAKGTPERPGAKSLDLHEDPTEDLVRDTSSGEGTEFEPKQDVMGVRCLSRHRDRDGSVGTLH